MLGDIVFNCQQALRYGLVEAIILRAFERWFCKGRGDGSCYEREQELWLQLTIAQMQGDLPFLSPYKIRTSLDNLVYEKLLKTDEETMRFGLRKRKTIGYTVTDKGAELVNIYKHPAEFCEF